MFNAQQMSSLRPQGAAASRPAAAPHPPPAAAPSMSPEETKAHEDAKRFARLVVSEIKLYNEAKVNEGRRHKDIYERLKEDIERGRQMYADRVAPHVRDSTNYFYDELVRILAGGDQGALGPM
jgi:ribonuclease HI